MAFSLFSRFSRASGILVRSVLGLPVIEGRLADPVLLDFRNGRAAQKARFGGEFFIAHRAATPSGTRFLNFFQRDKSTGEAKGIIAIDLGGFT